MNCVQDIPSATVEGATFYFSAGFCFLGRGEAKGRGQGRGCTAVAAAPRVLAGEPLLYPKGVERHETPLSLLRPVLLLIQPDGVYFTDCCVMFIVADSNHLHAHQFLR